MENHRNILNVWNISDPLRKQSLLNRFIARHGDSYSNREFLIWLAKEYGLGKDPNEAKKQD